MRRQRRRRNNCENTSGVWIGKPVFKICFHEAEVSELHLRSRISNECFDVFVVFTRHSAHDHNSTKEPFANRISKSTPQVCSRLISPNPCTSLHEKGDRRRSKASSPVYIT